MTKMSPIKKMCICAICIALCYVLPVAFHTFNIGREFSPMHFPVLLCGLLLGPWYGLACGIIGPVLSSFSGMPPLPQLLHMVPELCVYGLVAGLMMNLVRTKKLTADLYISLAVAMLAGRIAGGIAQVLEVWLLSTVETFSIPIWLTSYFVVTLPGTVAQLAVLPILVIMLQKTKLIPARYQKTAGV